MWKNKRRIRELEEALFNALRDVLWKGARPENVKPGFVPTSYTAHVRTNDIVRAEELLEQSDTDYKSMTKKRGRGRPKKR